MSVTRVFKNKEFYFVLIALIACLIHKLSFRIIMSVGYNLVGITPYIAAFLFVFVLCYEKRSFKTAAVEFLLGFAVLAAADWTVTRLLSAFFENLLWFALIYTPLHTALFSALIITAYAAVCGYKIKPYNKIAFAAALIFFAWYMIANVVTAIELMYNSLVFSELGVNEFLPFLSGITAFKNIGRGSMSEISFYAYLAAFCWTINVRPEERRYAEGTKTPSALSDGRDSLF